MSELATLVTMIATAVIAATAIGTYILTRTLVRENQLLREAGTEPDLVARLTTDARHPSMLNFAVSNIGNGVAKSCRIKFGSDFDMSKLDHFAIRSGRDWKSIGLIPPGGEMSTFFAQGFRVIGDEPLPPFTVQVEFRNRDGVQHEREFRLDVADFDWVGSLGKPPEQEVADSLREMQKDLRSIVSGIGRLKVETITTQERRAEAKESIESQKRKRAEQEKPRRKADDGQPDSPKGK